MKALLLVLMGFAATGALAQGDYPNRPLRLIVTVPPGGAGTIAADAVAKAPADGYTLLQNSITTHGVGPHLYDRLPYDPVRDFAPVSGLALLPLVMAVNADVPAKNVQELIQLSKSSSLNFASSGNGGAPH